MKNVGCIGYINHSGLGQIISNFRKNLPLTSQLVIEHPQKGTFYNELPKDFLYTSASMNPTKEDLFKYLDKCNPDIVLIFETPFNFDFFKILRERNVRVVLFPMIDSISVSKFLPYQEYINLIVNFTTVGDETYDKVWKGCGIHLPYPVDVEIFKPIEHGENLFLHNEGFGGAGFRKGTDITFVAFQQLMHNVSRNVSMRVLSQKAESEHSQIRNIKNVEIISKDLPNVIDTYKSGKVYVAPSRREGLGLPILEAMACGLPVITTNAAPMNEWFEDDTLLVKVRSKTDLPYGDIPMYTPDVFDLMQKMKWCIENQEKLVQIGEENCNIIREKFSWNNLKQDYWSVL